MALERQRERQSELMVTRREMPGPPRHTFYDWQRAILIEAGFDAFAAATCEPVYTSKVGVPSVPPGRYFRMHLVGDLEGIVSERGFEWRYADSLSQREPLRLETTTLVPDHSWLLRTRSRLTVEVHKLEFGRVLKLIAEHGLVKGERISVNKPAALIAPS